MLKLLIVEDEAGIRNSLANAFSWTELGCELIGCAGSGIEALEVCLQTPPDIIISDIVMPGIDGLTFLKYIKEKNPSTQFIILTGHRNFDYAKDALNLGAAFFMLKPINYIELKTALEKLIRQLLSADKQQENKNRQEQVLRSILNGRIFSKSHLTPHVRQLLDSLNLYRIVVIEFDDATEDAFRTQNLANYCSQILENSPVIQIRTDDSHLALLYRISSEKEKLTDFKEFLQQFQNRIYCNFRQPVSFGVSARQYGAEHLSDAYVQALRSLGRRFFTGPSSINFFSDHDLEEAALSPGDQYTFTEECEKITELIQNTSVETLVPNSPELFRSLVHPLGKNADTIKSTLLLLICSSARKIFGNDIRQINLFFRKYDYFSSVIKTDSLQYLEDLFLNVLLDLSDYFSTKNKSRHVLIDTILHFIHENYQKNITLSDISKKVYLSPAYCSSLITSETGKNFVDILNEIRIQKAIELLRDPGKKISEIAYAVGFREAQYFSITFKKYTELTPRDYREIHLKVKKET